MAMPKVDIFRVYVSEGLKIKFWEKNSNNHNNNVPFLFSCIFFWFFFFVFLKGIGQILIKALLLYFHTTITARVLLLLLPTNLKMCRINYFVRKKITFERKYFWAYPCVFFFWRCVCEFITGVRKMKFKNDKKY